MYSAGYVSAILLLALKDFPPFQALSAAFLGAVFSASLIPALSFFLYRAKKIPIIVTSYLFSLAACSAVSSLIIYFASGDLLATEELPARFCFAHILPPSFLSLASISAPVFALAFYFFFGFTRKGKRLLIVGKAPLAAYHFGYSVELYKFSALIISGGMHGIAGFFLTTSTFHRCHPDFQAGLGWNALSVALLSSKNSLLVLPFSLFLSWIFIFIDRISILYSLPLSVRTILEGVLLFLIASFSFYKKKT